MDDSTRLKMLLEEPHRTKCRDIKLGGDDSSLIIPPQNDQISKFEFGQSSNTQIQVEASHDCSGKCTRSIFEASENGKVVWQFLPHFQIERVKRKCRCHKRPSEPHTTSGDERCSGTDIGTRGRGKNRQIAGRPKCMATNGV